MTLSQNLDHQLPPLKDPSLLIERAYINGKFITSGHGNTFDVLDPATNVRIGSCPDLTFEEAEQAIHAADAAFPLFRATNGRHRAHLLRQWLSEIEKHADDLAALITWESGKALCDAQAEVAYAASYVEWFAEEAPRIYGTVIPSSYTGRRIASVRQPVGVCGLITPWNFPAAMVTRKVAPALAAGCTVVLKSAGETPFTANALVELAHRAGIPPGVINVITALENTVVIGMLLTTHPKIKKVSFTGSTAVGKILMTQSSGTLKKLSMELGGNSPFIVFDGCPDLDDAVAGALAAKFRGSGQTCVAANRIFVQEGIHDTFVREFSKAVTKFKVGNGFGQGVTHGPAISIRAVEKMEIHVQDAVAKGAEVIVGGTRLPHLGPTFFTPTVLKGMKPNMQMFREETFGPVAGIYSFSTEEEVVELANDTQVGLAGYVFSRDVDRIHRVSEALDVGMVGVNTGVISDAAVPFGGVRESGFGREGSKYGVGDYTVLKTMVVGTK